jgi:hypothetical protein
MSSKDEKLDKLAGNFNEKNSHLVDDIKKVTANLLELRTKKLDAIQKLMAIEHEDPQRFHDDSLAIITSLEKILRLERRYIEMVMTKFLRFKREAQKLNAILSSYSYGPVFESVPGFKNLTGKYLRILLEICDLVGKSLYNIKKINSRQLDHIHKSQGRLFTRDFRDNLTEEFNKYLSVDSRKSEVNLLVERLEKAQRELTILGIEVKHTYQALRPTFKLILAGGSICALLSGTIIGVIEVFVAFVGIFALGNLKRKGKWL